MYRVWNFLTNYSLLLIIGAITALIWANTNAVSYHHFVDYVIWDHSPIGHYHHGHRTLSRAGFELPLISILVSQVSVTVFESFSVILASWKTPRMLSLHRTGAKNLSLSKPMFIPIFRASFSGTAS